MSAHDPTWSPLVEKAIKLRVDRALLDERMRQAAAMEAVERASYQRGYEAALGDVDAVVATSLTSLVRSARAGVEGLVSTPLTVAWLKGQGA